MAMLVPLLAKHAHAHFALVRMSDTVFVHDHAVFMLTHQSAVGA